MTKRVQRNFNVTTHCASPIRKPNRELLNKRKMMGSIENSHLIDNIRFY